MPEVDIANEGVVGRSRDILESILTVLVGIRSSCMGKNAVDRIEMDLP